MNFISAAPSVTTWIFIALLAVMVIVLVVLPMFTNKKRNKAISDLHGSLRPGDVIKTVGGIVGKIVAIKEVSPVDKEMVIETGEGDNKSTLVFDVQAVYQVLSKVNEPAPVFEEVSANEPAAAEEAAKEETPEAPAAEVVEEAPAAKSEDVKETSASSTEVVEEAAPAAKSTVKTTSKTKKTN